MTTDRPPAPPIRRLSVGDLAILVAAVALTFARLPSNVEGQAQVIKLSRADPYFVPMDRLLWWFAMLETGLMWSTFALTAIHLRPPRPRWSRLMRQPGWIACFAGSIGLLLGLAIDWADAPLRRIYGDGYGYFLSHDLQRPPYTTLFAGSAVLVAWSILISSRRCRCARVWTDRVGRIIGAGWLLMWLWAFGLHLAWQPM